MQDVLSDVNAKITTIYKIRQQKHFNEVRQHLFLNLIDRLQLVLFGSLLDN